MKFNVYLKTIQEKGNLAYEYHPLRNYQTSVKLYYDESEKYIIPEGCAVYKKTGEILTKPGDNWITKSGKIIKEEDCIFYDNTNVYAEAGSLIDLDTEQLNFDLNHPVDIQILPSYDGSVNLILNDDKNIPRLINSRFSVREQNTYEIVDRIGENDTNIYNSETFDKDTSLYFQYETNPIISFKGYINGVLPVGLYCFYFTYCDADDNESDFIAETGLIPVFIGNNSDPFSMDGGIKNQSSNKGIRLTLSNVDKSYNYYKVYYVRYFADYQQNRVSECKRLYLKYPINSNILTFQFSGNEEAEDIDANILNISRFNPKSVLTSALCKNMLFFGNIVKNVDNYKELLDCALRIIPSVVTRSLGDIDSNYIFNSADCNYYDAKNVYDKTGYFPNEYYRFGVVFIYLNGQLSNVYNTLGYNMEASNLISYKSNSMYEDDIKNGNITGKKRKYISIDDFGWIPSPAEFFEGNLGYLNARGVCKLNQTTLNENDILGIKFSVPKEITEFLTTLGIRGLFFVRQKRVPNIIALCLILPMDEVLEAPVILSGNNSYITESFLELDKDYRNVSNNYNLRLFKYDKGESSISINAYAAICPDFLLDLPYYNQIFNGSLFKLLDCAETTVNSSGRYYNYETVNSLNYDRDLNTVTISSVTENVSQVALKNKVYKLEVGKAEESYRFGYAGVDNSTYTAGGDDSDVVNKSINLVRGIYSPYLAVYSDYRLNPGHIYNIYSNLSIDSENEYKNRMDSSDPFYAISNRYNFKKLDIDRDTYNLICWRGDCYTNQFTYRLNRNFNDPTLPNNDQIIDKETWKNNYDINDSTKWKNISRSDINAVLLGNWITFKVRSYMNYAFRSVDHSYVSEEALMGSPRTFYPRGLLMWRGVHKLPDSYLYNDAYRASLGFKCYFTLQDINYIKNVFSNRIQYSAISVQDSYKNNYRYSLNTYFRDYSQEYGSIQKLVGFEGYLLVIFEHGIGIATVNERVLAGNGDGGPVFINTLNVLPEEIAVVSDTYGTLWPESIVKSEAGYVYGVDTIAKKIWRVKGQQIEILSDFKVNKFLVNNITLGERENYIVIGLKNVKSHYNNNKKDVMFTFYDDVKDDEEKVWNLCYNELLGEFVTFYSWVPSYSENIDTQFFTFNRSTSKELALLGKSNYSIESNTGILIESPVINISNENLSEKSEESKASELGTLHYRDSLGKEHNEYKFKIEKDHWLTYKIFGINNEEKNDPKTGSTTYESKIIIIKENDAKEAFSNRKILLLRISAWSNDTTRETVETIAITLSDYLKNYLLLYDAIKDIEKGGEGKSDYNNVTVTDFYLHGKSGIIDMEEPLLPTFWYDELHPFEFEVVVNDKIAQLKIFSNLVIISNKAEPESFHFEIEGDNYEFSNDKRAMYIRQEATKLLYLNLGSDILYDRDYALAAYVGYTRELYYRKKGSDYENSYSKIDRVYPVSSEGLVQQVKSTIFPLYYEKIDTYNDVYYKYHQMKSSNSTYDFENLSGSEIAWDKDLNLFSIVIHIKNSPVDLVGRLRGNSIYKEGTWRVLIPSISFMLKNEDEWKKIESSDSNSDSNYLYTNEVYGIGKDNKLPYIVINSQYVPKDLTENSITSNKLPNIYTGRLNSINENDSDSITDPAEYVKLENWTNRKETKIRDKWMKVRVRYSGKNLAIIHSLLTLYNISYA